jgi:glucose/arabinose dehydrogenase
MIRRHPHSGVRFFQATTLAGACSFAACFGPGCSDSDVTNVGVRESSRPDSNGVVSQSPDGVSVSDGTSPADTGEASANANESSADPAATDTPPLDSTPAAVSSGSGAAVEPSSPPSPLDPSAQPPAPSDSEPAGVAAADCDPPEGALPGLHLTEVVTGLDQPTFAAAAPGDDRRLFVLERTGAIRIVRDGQLLGEPFLNLRERVETSNEEGLVGLAFHPDYQHNGRFFVQYASLDPARPVTADRQIILSEFARSSSDAERADPASERTLMVVEQPADIHLAGMLAFGPTDGMLYISRGDGGGDAQDLQSWLGKMLRIDVDVASDGRPYGIPPGNMAGAGVLPEIWSLGLRNPWRFAFDACTADIYIGDVGESTFEEIDFEPADSPGNNYGWKTLEGPQCFDDATQSCDASGFELPALTLDRDFSCAVIGGYVYRGQRIPALRGTYLYADYCFGHFGSLHMEGGQTVDAREITDDINPGGVSLITSFGVDNAGELYVLSQRGGLYRIDPD